MARLRARADALVLPPEAPAPEAVLLPVPDQSGARGQAIPAGAVWTAGLRMP